MKSVQTSIFQFEYVSYFSIHLITLCGKHVYLIYVKCRKSRFIRAFSEK